ncbi:choice-of-anchor L domain-containing protein [Chryseobacterium sp. MDT2-18]|uniref:choice-of-anchor L domain-containing protein n=1 Tax=Chryseobacterium sp. MDT2-18 TaxID=1259136 RepID=UPI002780F54D|nr:choice-of-anchor L domain-containing protein [Chryseobacterium sp. MDT2-18]MDQ0477921.1 gliding motility-associated-like protein [Chryseobacterium sp. MDT2-18]
MKNNYLLKYFLTFVLTISIISLNAQYISVDTQTYTPEQLVKEVFFGNQSSSCISVENVSISGWDFGNGKKSYGYFDRTGSAFEMEKGILLSTGDALTAPGPNDYIQSGNDSRWIGDRDLEDALNVSSTYNATILEFDFTATNTNRISFEYLFASEQYLVDGKGSQCNFTDGFAFLIKEAGSSDSYRNLAVIPGTNIPIKSSTVRGPGGLCAAINEQYFAQYNPYESPTNFNGQTKILNAITDIIPGVKYHLKLVIADEGNGLYDSAVFLKAGSFVGIKDLGADLVISSQTALCEGSTTQLDASITAPGATYQWYNAQGIITGATNPLYTVRDAGTYEVLIDDRGCKLKGSIKIEYAEKPIYNPNNSFCNYNEGKPIAIYLQQLNSQIISNYKSYFKVKYYRYETDAIEGNDNTIDTIQYSEDTTIYVRTESSECDTPVETINFKTPKKSAFLIDQIICPNSTTRLEVEDIFAYYKWMRENGEIIAEGDSVNSINNVGIGKYFVQLKSLNGCFLQQEVNVLHSELPQITNVEVTGNTATVFVSGGNPPYQYSLDNITFQSSNTLTNIPRGLRKVYVKDAQNCETVQKEFLILNLINVITPNADGKNDVLDYSDLSIKKDVKIEIFDRYGNQVFISQKTPYIWDGKMNGSVLPTGTYWYILNWTEPDTNLPVSYKGWILLKNRN